MNVVTENSSEKTLEKVADENPISVYSVNFTQIINDAEREYLMKRSKTTQPARSDNRSSLSKRIFKWRNAVAVGAILTVGMLHFVYQLSVIKTEKLQIAEVPPKVEQVRQQAPLKITKPFEFEAKKTDAVLPPKPAPALKQRQPETAPAKPQPKKKEAVETRAERLRRAEKILTGV